MKYFLILFLLLSSPARADTFFETLSDVPVMVGLVEIKDMGSQFDAPQGKIAEAAAWAQDSAAAEQVLTFYHAVLPEMGWVPQGDGNFVRDGYMLKITWLQAETGVVFRFNMMPSL